MRIAFEQVQHPGPIWVYRIRPTDNFYSVNDSLDAAMRFSFSEATARSAGFLLLSYERQGEWVALRTISPDQIESATQYRFEDGNIIEGETRPNPHYRPAEANPNRGVYPFNGVANTPFVDRLLIPGGRYLSLAYGFCLAGISRVLPHGGNLMSMNTKENEEIKDWCEKPVEETLEQHMAKRTLPAYSLLLLQE